MHYFPIFVAIKERPVLISGGGAMAVARLRLLMKTSASLVVFAVQAEPQIEIWAREGRLVLLSRAVRAGDLKGAALLYITDEAADDHGRLAAMARANGIPVNIVDNLENSTFITPAIVDRDPVTIAIGTEGAAPVLARAIKRDLEERLPVHLGLLAKAGKVFRPLAKRVLDGRKHREFWAEYYADTGLASLDESGAGGLPAALDALLARYVRAKTKPGHVDLVGAGPGDPDLLTLKARKALDRADVVIHDQLVAPEILELARREAVIIAAGKKGFGPATPQEKINVLMIDHARSGAHVVRLKSGDPAMFGRLDEEIEALDNAAIAWRIIPGITAASAAIAQIGQSFTCRGRNSSIRFLTGYDVKGFAEQDWRALARPAEVAAIYMGKKSARFLQGRLLMNNADANTPITLVENASRQQARIISTTLAELPGAVAGLQGPVVMLLGLAPRHMAQEANRRASVEQAL
ncbi:MAG: siroheme synthase CysG [Robiginitomaculum sp.]|nr:siroheme synthase CysG [Robiginitomaculum sp.]MDQ7077202.1 siroheme synthase CysG [Robiginitomaculum sp.]